MMFSEKVLSARGAPLAADRVEVLQVNLGTRCNMACSHCHLAAGPLRYQSMDRSVAGEVVRLLEPGNFATLDLTGGAPELNPQFRRLVRKARELGRHVIVRTNLTVFFERGMQDLPEFFRDSGVEVIASLPCYSPDGVEKVRGKGAFSLSISGLRQLNRAGYGQGDPRRRLSLVYNPAGAFLPPDQARLEADYRKELAQRFGISFDRLLAFSNVPIGRFRERLAAEGSLERYMQLLRDAFNPANLDALMCRRLVSVRWDGALFDCDFNLALGVGLAEGCPQHISRFDTASLSKRAVSVAEHCFACAAGQGST